MVEVEQEVTEGLNTKEADQEVQEVDVEDPKLPPPLPVDSTLLLTTMAPALAPDSEETPALDQLTLAMELQEVTLEAHPGDLLVDMEEEDVMLETLICLTPSTMTLQK